jgi:hypothetical protein
MLQKQKQIFNNYSIREIWSAFGLYVVISTYSFSCRVFQGEFNNDIPNVTLLRKYLHLKAYKLSIVQYIYEYFLAFLVILCLGLPTNILHSSSPHSCCVHQ